MRDELHLVVLPFEHRLHRNHIRSHREWGNSGFDLGVSAQVLLGVSKTDGDVMQRFVKRLGPPFLLAVQKSIIGTLPFAIRVVVAVPSISQGGLVPALKFLYKLWDVLFPCPHVPLVDHGPALWVLIDLGLDAVGVGVNHGR